ncbi:MAG: FAD-binding oxidoreductase [Chloroflexota bacterium]
MATTVAQEIPINSLRAQLRGPVIARGDEGYDAARAVYNAMIDRHPGVIARCVDVADVVSAVNFARENHITIAVRGGGHNGGGLGTCDDGLVIDLSLMKGTRVDPGENTVRVAGGCTWGDVDHATHAYGLATPSGIISTTGVGGLTLGGGIGNLSRKCGLSIDNLLSVDMVLADGSIVTASAEENPDLFWAVRGGGGNFGIVTSFLFRLHPVSMVFGGLQLWDTDRAGEILRWYRDFITHAPDDINGWFAYVRVPPGPPFPEEIHNKVMCGIVWCYAGTEEGQEAAFAPVRALPAPALELLGWMPYPAIQSMFDAVYPPGYQWYWRADFVRELSDEAIAVHEKFGPELPFVSTMHLYPINGAVHRAGKNDTAFSYRDVIWAEVIVGVDPDAANAGTIRDWCVSYWDALHPYSAGGAYVNFMMDEGQDRIRATYRDNYDRLVQVKNKYDPSNLFHVNQNIRPTV